MTRCVQWMLDGFFCSEVFLLFLFLCCCRSGIVIAWSRLSTHRICLSRISHFVFLCCFSQVFTTAMAEPIWTEAKEELATEQEQIPPLGLATGHCYDVLLLSAYSLSDFLFRLRERQGEYLSLMSKLREIYVEEPSWLRLRLNNASRHIPIAYINDDDWVGRFYIAVELLDDTCVVYDADEGTFDYIGLDRIYRLGVDHAAVPAFCSRMAIAGVKPMTWAMWSQDLCSAIRKKIMSSPPESWSRSFVEKPPWLRWAQLTMVAFWMLG